MRILTCPIDTPGFAYPAVSLSVAAIGAGHRLRQVCPLRGVPRGTISAPFIDDPAGFAIERWFEQPTVQEQHRVVRRAIDEWRPDLVLTSMLAMGSLIAARRAGIPVAVLGLMSHVWPADERLTASPPAGYQANRTLRLAECQKLLGEAADWVGAGDSRDWRHRDALLGDAFLLRSSALLEPYADRLPRQVHFVGPSRWEPGGQDAADVIEWAQAGPPLIYAQLGRVFRKGDVWGPLLEIAHGCEARIIVDIGRSDSAAPSELPSQIRCVSLPFSDPLVRKASLVYTTGGSSAVLAALSHGRPLALVPTGGEQRVVAEVCAGWKVATEWPAAPAAYVDEVLAGRHHTCHAATTVAEVFASGEGTVDPVRLLESLAA